MDEDGKQLVASGDTNGVELAGPELIITRRSNTGVSTKALGSREFLRYYRQKPRPSPVNDMAITAALASRFDSSSSSLRLCYFKEKKRQIPIIFILSCLDSNRK